MNFKQGQSPIGNLSCFSQGSSRKMGILGGIIATFVAIVVILIILLVFILGSGVIKKVTGADEGIKIYNETDVGIGNVFSYLPNYVRLMEVKVLMRQGQSFEDAEVEAGYGG